MVDFQRPLLASLLRVAVKDPGALSAVDRSLRTLGIGELGAPIRKQDVNILAEDIRAKRLLQFVDPGDHVLGGLAPVKEPDHDAAVDELEGLDEGAVGPIVVDGVHLDYREVGILVRVCQVVAVCAAFEVLAIFPFLQVWIGLGFVHITVFALCLVAELEDIDVLVEVLECAVLDVPVHGAKADTQLWVCNQDLIRSLALPHQFAHNPGNSRGLRRREVGSNPGSNECLFVLALGLRGRINDLVEPAPLPVGAAVASTRGPIPAAAVEGGIVRAVLRARLDTSGAVGAILVVGALFGQ